MDDDVDRAKKYVLVRDSANNLYLVGKDETVKPIPAAALGPVTNKLDTVEEEVEDLLEASNLTPSGSSVRVRVPKILDQ